MAEPALDRAPQDGMTVSASALGTSQDEDAPLPSTVGLEEAGAGKRRLGYHRQ